MAAIFSGLAHRIEGERNVARSFAQPEEIAIELFGYIQRTDAFADEHNSARDAAYALHARRGILRACMDRADTPPQDAERLHALDETLVATINTIIQCQLLTEESAQDSLLLLAHEIQVTFDPSQQ